MLSTPRFSLKVELACVRSQRRWMSRLRWITKRLPGSFHLEHQVESGLVKDGALLVRQLKILPDKAHVEAGSLSNWRSGRNLRTRVVCPCNTARVDTVAGCVLRFRCVLGEICSSRVNARDVQELRDGHHCYVPLAVAAHTLLGVKRLPRQATAHSDHCV